MNIAMYFCSDGLNKYHWNGVWFVLLEDMDPYFAELFNQWLVGQARPHIAGKLAAYAYDYERFISK